MCHPRVYAPNCGEKLPTACESCRRTLGPGVEIEIYSDVVCPWCYVGTARLDVALASYDGEAILRWRPFQMDPDASSQPATLLAWLSGRVGGPDRARTALASVTATAQSEGLHIDVDRAVIADTFAAHRLLWFADRPEAVVFGAHADTQPELARALCRAHFADGLDISSHDVLATLADRVGLDADRVYRLLSSTEGTADVRAQLAHAHDVGITSVPTFVFAGTYVVTGAQTTQALRSVLDQVARREGFAPTPRSLIPEQRAAPAAADSDRG
jgi:predicted DsbA family dithiol-disulfide isomerase